MTDEKPKAPKKIIDDLMERAMGKRFAQREEILEAFVAKYGFNPDEAVQIEQQMSDGSIRWRVERNNELSRLRKFTELVVEWMERDIFLSEKVNSEDEKYYQETTKAIHKVLKALAEEAGLDFEKVKPKSKSQAKRIAVLKGEKNGS